ncbi:bifunctional (p)ppGpp synthetase/guanosine-3',5'-bis(diphosphate) 3'-pyrophosphohydrolase [Kineosporia sp. J2-2]|uniref:Bifunctional (P)ppGpp synthetase/guanosine-3',5'-bis(Diphosphate) 3'-pyrophosphohydrolase n=1 Tax=Kineosporia corallincola TaxID=2835133 RepID=A0ABS5TB94_9ACTN|nr:HD domain-containing protein [Kineosporia corallincola]MBT0768113.1 bifunctional (p)ppGpp synthetase/guanosine-3',5'-bis(diphosphate) 3'-pyrophosphohydrolase [Kineosporia corallincola]
MIRTFDGWPDWTSARPALEPALTLDALDRLSEVYDFAAERHAGQTRPAGEPYVEHLLQVVDVLVHGSGWKDTDLLAAGLLHDVVEDTPTELAEVADRFGDGVGQLVDWVTQPPRDPAQDKAIARKAYLDHLAQAPDHVLALKLADRLTNVQHLDTHPRPHKQASYYRETVTYIVPLADRLPWYRAWFEDWRQEFAHLAQD